MALRFTCPCGAPYALADEMAGRTVQCTRCQRQIKIAAPAPPAAPNQADLASSMAWGAAPPGPSGGASPSGLDLAPGVGVSGEGHVLPEDPPAPPRRATSGSGRAGPSRRAPSGSGRASDRRRGAKRGGRPDPAAHSRSCPVCDEVIARIAAECPNCGVVLRGPSQAAQVAAAVKGWLAPAAGVLLLVGAIVYATNHLGASGPPPQVARRPAAPSPQRDGSPTPPERPVEPPEPEAGGPVAEPVGEVEPAARPGEAEPPDRAPPSPDPSEPAEDGDGAGPALPELPATPAARAAIPDGPLAPLFEQLRDADDSDVPRLLDELAAADGVEAAASAAAESDDDLYRLRVHRLRLRLGDEAARRERITASLREDGHGLLLETTLAALAMDADGFRAALGRLAYHPRSLLSRALADAMLDGASPGDSLYAEVVSAHRSGDPTSRRVAAPLALWCGDLGSLEATLAVLDHPSPILQELARRALLHASAGFGPEAGDSDAWRRWGAEVGPPVASLVAASDPSTPAGERARACAALAGRGADLLTTLAIFMRDRRSRSDEGADLVGRLLARVAGPRDGAAIERVLDGIERAKPGRAAPLLIGALLAADAAIAPAVARRYLTLEPPPLDLGDWAPDLQEAPPDEALAALWDFARSRSRKERHQVYALLGSLRSARLAAVVLANEREDEPVRQTVMARLGDGRVEEAVLAVALEAGPQVAGLGGPTVAYALLGKAGTSAAALPGLLKLLKEEPFELAAVQALRRLVGPDDAKKLRKALAATEHRGRGGVLCEALADLGSKADADALAKKADAEGSDLARKALLELARMGAPRGRALVLEAFERFVQTGGERRPGIDAVRRLARCGVAEDGAYLRKLLELGADRSKTYFGEVILALGEVGDRSALGVIEGYCFRGHDLRAPTAVALAVLEAKDRADRLRATALAEDAPAKARDEDAVVVAALAALVGSKARDVAEAYVEGALARTSEGVGPTAVAYALTLAEHAEGLARLAAAPSPRTRADVARGVAWAALTRTIAAPAVLERLRFDPDAVVRAEAAVARGYLAQPEAARDIALALTWAAPHLDAAAARHAATPLGRLAAVEDLATLRAALWDAYRVATRKGMAYREGLGEGRRREVEREIRAGK